MLLAALGAVLALALFALRGGLQPAAPLEKLARRVKTQVPAPSYRSSDRVGVSH